MMLSFELKGNKLVSAQPKGDLTKITQEPLYRARNFSFQFTLEF